MAYTTVASTSKLNPRVLAKKMRKQKGRFDMAKRKKKKMTKSDKIRKASFDEIKANPPKVLAKTRRKYGAADAEAQRVAIGLSKARAAGARIPSNPRKMTDAQIEKKLGVKSKRRRGWT
jgi:hypothetical protein